MSCDHHPSAPPGDAAISPDLLEEAMLIRGVEQRLLDLFSEGKPFGTVHTCIVAVHSPGLKIADEGTLPSL